MLGNEPVALILGGTKGLGKEIALKSLHDGDKIVVAGSSVVREYEEDGITYIPCDLLARRSVNDLISKIENNQLPPISKFFWVAGRLLKGDFAKQSSREIDEVMSVNFVNPTLIARAVWAQMQKATEECQFVVISSSSGVKARKDEAVYVATKHAQVGFTRSLGMENSNPNVKVSLFMPGGMKTSFWDKNPTPDYDSFLDPKKVAQNVVVLSMFQDDLYEEYEIPRGSL